MTPATATTKLSRLAEKKNQHPPGHDMDISTVEEMERVLKDYGPNEQGGSMCNVISIEEVPDEYKGEGIVYADPGPWGSHDDPLPA